MFNRDPYEVLGVSKNATQQEIKSAYRSLVRKYHPDVNSNKAEAEEKFKEITFAYNILSDENKRSQFDQYGTVSDGQSDPFTRAGSGSGFEDIFDFFFGGAGQQSERRRPAGRDGEDIRYDLEITLEEVLEGANKSITYSRSQVCTDCRGIGSEGGEAPEKCTVCNGQGTVSRVQNTFIGQMRTSTTCSTCNGQGSVIKKKCKTCRGNGFVSQQTELKLELPPGLEDGATLHYPGKGGESTGAGRPGDLYVVISIKENERFIRKGNDLFTQLDISFGQAALGSKVKVEGLDGEIELNIPAGTQPAKMFKIPKKGVPGIHRSPRGDLFVEVDVTVPTKLNEEQKELIHQLEKSLQENSQSSSEQEDGDSFLGQFFKKKK